MITTSNSNPAFFRPAILAHLLLVRGGELAASQSARFKTHSIVSVFVVMVNALGFPYWSISLPKECPGESVWVCLSMLSSITWPLSKIPKNCPDRPRWMMRLPGANLNLCSFASRKRRLLAGSSEKMAMFCKSGTFFGSFIVPKYRCNTCTRKFFDILIKLSDSPGIKFPHGWFTAVAGCIVAFRKRQTDIALGD